VRTPPRGAIKIIFCEDDNFETINQWAQRAFDDEYLQPVPVSDSCCQFQRRNAGTSRREHPASVLSEPSVASFLEGSGVTNRENRYVRTDASFLTNNNNGIERPTFLGQPKGDPLLEISRGIGGERFANSILY
jgi:hypothetical protein